MAGSRLHKQRRELKLLVEVVGIPHAEKGRWRKHIPRMLPSELLELRRNLLEQLVLDAQFETIDEIRMGKHAQVGDEGLLQVVLRKVLQRADQVEERLRSA